MSGRWHTLKALLLSARPWQWPKNLLAALGALMAGGGVLDALCATLAMIMASAAVYLLNDLRDAEEDRRDPAKATRPLASGELTAAFALFAGGTLAVGATLLAGDGRPVLLLYLLVNFLYSMGGKRIAHLEILLVSVGFPLRVLLGSLYAGEITPGALHLTVWLAAIGVVAAKRHGEIRENHDARSVNRFYTETGLIGLRRTALLVAVLTTASTGFAGLLPAGGLALAFLRLDRLAAQGRTARPDRAAFTDPWMLLGIVLWAVSAWLS
jgi:decaprenyl-phosphate phosphoribosyltransferase